MAQMELALDPGEQDLLGFLLEQSGDLGETVEEELAVAPLDWELSEVGGVPSRAKGGRSARPQGW